MLRTRILNTQSQYAAIVIQRHTRGFQTRKLLWSWDGMLTRSRVVKIQKVYRGFLGRCYARYLFRLLQHHYANKIIGLFYGWKARRLVAILKAEHVWNCVIRVQKRHRGNVGRAIYAAYRFKVHTKMALVIQRVARGYLGKRRARGIKLRMSTVLQDIRSLLQRDSDIAMSFKRITIETYSPSGADEWTLFQLCMCNLLGTQRLEIAVDLAVLLCNKAPHFGPAKFAYLCCLLSAWPDVGKAHIVREDWLEEAMFLLLQLRAKGKEFNLFSSLVPTEGASPVTSQYIAANAQPITIQPMRTVSDMEWGFEPMHSNSKDNRVMSMDKSEVSDSSLHSVEKRLPGGLGSAVLPASEGSGNKTTVRGGYMHVPDNDDDSYTVSLGIGPLAEDGQSQSTLLEVQSLQSGVSVGNEQFIGPHSHVEYDLLSTEEDHHDAGVDSNPGAICVYTGDAAYRGSTINNGDGELEIESLPSPPPRAPQHDTGSDSGSPTGQHITHSYRKMSSYMMPDPPWMRDMDPISYFYGGLLEEIEYAFFRNCLVRYEKNLANLIQMASCVFAVNAASLGDGTSSDMAVVRAATRDGRRTPSGEPEMELQVLDMRGKGAGIGRARRLLTRANRLSGQVDAESMGYRLQVMENLFEAQHKEVFRQRRQLKDVSAEVFESRYLCKYLKDVHGIDFKGANVGILDPEPEPSKNKSDVKRAASEAQSVLDQFKVNADIVCYRCGSAMLVTTTLSVISAKDKSNFSAVNSATSKTRASTANTPVSRTFDNTHASTTVDTEDTAGGDPLYSIYTTQSDKWRTGLVARPLVLLPHEVESMHAQAIPFFCNALRQDENAVRMRGRWRNIAEYIVQFVRVASCGVEQDFRKTSIYEPHLTNAMRESVSENPKVRINGWMGSDDVFIDDTHIDSVPSEFPTSRIRVVLPMVEYRRRERNSIRVESTAVILLQRAYRGFRSRALKRRLKARLFEDMRQHNRDTLQYNTLAKLRRHRYLMSAMIQAIMRGYLWRKSLNRMRVMALVIQCSFRIHKAKEKVQDERRRRSKGPPVIELLRKTTVISDVPLMLVGYRCGSNYKFIGYDFQNQLEYVGFVYQPEAHEFIQSHNGQIEGPRTGPRASKDLLSTWRHKQLMEALSNNLSITTMIPSATMELGASKYLTRNCLVLLKNSKGCGIMNRSGQRRMLPDTKECVPQGILDGLLSKAAKIHF